ncbi:MAG: VOC family protein [Jatrophihabitantaceae bacterium]
MNIGELRLVVTVDDYDAAVKFYRDTLGLTTSAEYLSEDQGRVIILDAGRATLEIGDAPHADHVDAVEVGRRVAGPVRVALRVGDVAAATRSAVEAGASLIAEPTRTPWNSLNSRLDGPGGLQLTLFEDLA